MLLPEAPNCGPCRHASCGFNFIIAPAGHRQQPTNFMSQFSVAEAEAQAHQLFNMDKVQAFGKNFSCVFSLPSSWSAAPDHLRAIQLT